MRKRASGFWAVALWAGSLAVLPASRGAGAHPAAPAVITHPTAASRRDLQLAVSRALGGAPVRLARDALTRDSVLIVGPAQARDLRGVPLNGRELRRPQHFRLLRRGAHCVLLHVETGGTRVLAHTSCRALPARHASG